MTDRPGILYINRVSFLGGAERALLIAMQQATRFGYRAILACPDGGRLPDTAREQGFAVEPCAFDGMRHTTNPLQLLRYASALRREGAHVARICRAHNVSLIHPHGPVAAMYGVHAAKHLGLPMVVHMHDAQPPKRSYRAATLYAKPYTARFIPSSQCVRAMIEGMGIPRSQTNLIYYGLDPSFMGARPEPTDQVSGPGPHIGLFGQIIRWKGQDVFLNAARLLADRLPTATFYIVGGLAWEGDRPYLEELERIAAAPELKGRVVFTGFQTNVPSWMMAMDVVVHASVEMEAFGLVIAEAMVMGKRVVATDVGGPTEQIEDRVTGRIVPPRDAEAMAEAIEDLANRAPDDPMGERGAAYIRSRFTAERYGEDLARLYGEVLGTPVAEKAA